LRRLRGWRLRLFEEHLGYAADQAAWHGSRLDWATAVAGLDQEDLQSFARVGLWQAAARFDPKRGVKFPTYAARRIRGAVLDGLRAADWWARRRVAAPPGWHRGMYSLDGPHPDPDRHRTDYLPATKDRGIEALEAADLFDWLVRGLPRRQREVMQALRHVATQREAGELLGLSESRISQLRRDAIAGCRARLDEMR